MDASAGTAWVGWAGLGVVWRCGVTEVWGHRETLDVVLGQGRLEHAGLGASKGTQLQSEGRLV